MSRPKGTIDKTSAENRDIVNVVIGQDTRHYGKAMKGKHRDQWIVAMTEELDALKSNDVWKIVVPPKGAHVLHNKWVNKTKNGFKRRHQSIQGSIFVCGFEQVFGVDYNLTFASVMDLVTVKLVW